MSITPAAISAVAANGVALAVAFGAHLSHPQQELVLAFVGSVSSLLFAIYSAVHVTHVKQAVVLATTPAPSSPASSSSKVEVPA